MLEQIVCVERDNHEAECRVVDGVQQTLPGSFQSIENAANSMAKSVRQYLEANNEDITDVHGQISKLAQTVAAVQGVQGDVWKLQVTHSLTLHSLLGKSDHTHNEDIFHGW